MRTTLPKIIEFINGLLTLKQRNVNIGQSIKFLQLAPVLVCLSDQLLYKSLGKNFRCTNVKTFVDPARLYYSKNRGQEFVMI